MEVSTDVGPNCKILLSSEFLRGSFMHAEIGQPPMEMCI